MERLTEAIDNVSQLYEEYFLSETDVVNIRPYDEALQGAHSLLENYKETGLTPDAIEQNKEYIKILEKENKLIKEQYIKEADTVDCYKKLAQENADALFREKAENAKLKEKLESVLNVASKFMVNSQDMNCVMCENPMKNKPFIRRDGEIYGCDGNCNVPNYTIDDVKKLILTHADKLKELGVE